MKYLIVYNSERVISVSEYSTGTAVVTPFNYMFAELTEASIMLKALNIDITTIEKYHETL